LIRLHNPSLINNAQSRRSMALASPASLPLLQPVHFATDAARKSIGVIPSWVLLGMIVVAGAAICLTVNWRASAERATSQAQLSNLSSEIEGLRRLNASLEVEIQRMNSDPALIESAARERLGMVKPTDIVVPITPARGTNIATLSFVR
jgi:cell division protein FtsB